MESTDELKTNTAKTPDPWQMRDERDAWRKRALDAEARLARLEAQQREALEYAVVLANAWDGLTTAFEWDL